MLHTWVIYRGFDTHFCFWPGSEGSWLLEQREWLGANRISTKGQAAFTEYRTLMHGRKGNDCQPISIKYLGLFPGGNCKLLGERQHVTIPQNYFLFLQEFGWEKNKRGSGLCFSVIPCLQSGESFQKVLSPALIFSSCQRAGMLLLLLPWDWHGLSKFCPQLVICVF